VSARSPSDIPHPFIRPVFWVIAEILYNPVQSSIRSVISGETFLDAEPALGETHLVFLLEDFEAPIVELVFLMQQ